MRKITPEERKKIQLDLMQSIHDYCEKNNIKYTLAFGSLLGAVRHKGFIPWDDDIDIEMLREDYDRFINSYYDEEHPFYKVNDVTTDMEYDIPFAKISDERTIFYENTNSKDVGIYIDVFPIDNLFDDKESCVAYMKKVYREIKIPRNVKYLRWDKHRNWYKNIFYYLLKPLLIGKSTRSFAEKLIKKGIFHKNIETKYVGLVCDGFKNLHSIVERSMFEEVVNMEFEDRSFKGIKRYDEYLTNEYGDYMTPPKNPCNHGITENSYWKDKF